MTYLRYATDIEKPAANEQETIDGIIKGMTQQSETVEAREHHAVRASHAKSSACVTGELTIAAGLPPELAQGLFAAPGTYPVALRFAQGPGETVSDRVSTHRGISIKVFDVPGEKLPGHAVDTQDFVLATGTTFPSGTAAGFLRDGTVIGKSTGLPEGVQERGLVDHAQPQLSAACLRDGERPGRLLRPSLQPPPRRQLLQPGAGPLRRLRGQARGRAGDGKPACPVRVAA